MKQDSDSIISLKDVRICFPTLFTPKQINGQGDYKFSASFLFPTNSPQHKAMLKAIEAVAKAKWPQKWESILERLRKKDHLCLKDGDLKSEYEGYEGNMFVNASNTQRPLVIAPDKSALAESDGKPYAGCYVNVSLSVWAQDNQFGQRINATLRGVQFLRDGDRFAGGGIADTSDFEDISDTGEPEGEDPLF